MSYLSERYQSIQIGIHLSSKTHLLRETPQGSVLGLLLFAITPLSNIIGKHDLNFRLYADDTRLYISFRPGTCDQVHALDRSSIVCVTSTPGCINCLMLNVSKAEVVVSGTKQKLSVANNIQVSVSNCFVSPIPVARNLGIVYDSTMNMEDHVNAM